MVKDKNVAYIGTFYPHHAEKDLQEIADMGCTSINMCVNEADWFFYRKSRREIIKVARELGLKVYLNFHNFGVFASNLPSGVYQMKNPESVQVYNTGKRGTFCCPNNDGFKQWLQDTLKEIVEDFDADGIFWDEPRFIGSEKFPEEWACRCDSCKDKFRKQYGRELPKTLDEDVIEFRQNSLLGFLQDMLHHSGKINAGENILCLMSFDRRDENNALASGWYGVTDWEPFIKLEGLDVFATDPYWIHSKTFQYFLDNAQDAIELAEKYDKESQIWIQSVWIPPGKEKEVKRTILKAADLGADRIAVWAFRGEPGSHYLDRGGDLEKAWNMAKEAYEEI